MKPPYEITPNILKLVASISEKIGGANAKHLVKVNPTLRKQNKIKTLHSTLSIEGNTLTEKQITAIVEKKKVLGPLKDITEVKNALKVYEEINQLNPKSEKDFLLAHKILMKDLIVGAGKYRTKGVGIVNGLKIEHIAPPSKNVPFLMKDLFKYLKNDLEIDLIKSCVFHYEVEFIHPFIDGNGRMGRLWQTSILMQAHPLFEFLPFETEISKNQKGYYKALASADKEGKSTKFIEFMLNTINHSLENLLENSFKKLSSEERIKLFLQLANHTFSRKEYLNYYNDLSTATASRDLKKAIELKLLFKTGDKKTTTYKK